MTLQFKIGEAISLPFVNGRFHLEQLLPFPTAVDALCKEYTVKRT